MSAHLLMMDRPDDFTEMILSTVAEYSEIRRIRGCRPSLSKIAVLHSDSSAMRRERKRADLTEQRRRSSSHRNKTTSSGEDVVA